jgi:hypothetical protein
MSENNNTCGIYNDLDNKWIIYAYRNNYVKLYYAGVEKLATNNGGVTVTGTVTATTFSGNATTATTATNQSGGTVSASTGSFSSAIYYNEWIRNNGTNASGLYWHNSSNPGFAWHIFPENQSDMTFRTGSGNGGIKGTVGNNTARGYIHWTTGNEIGFLNSSRQWSLRMDNSKNCEFYGKVGIKTGSPNFPLTINSTFTTTLDGWVHQPFIRMYSGLGQWSIVTDQGGGGNQNLYWQATNGYGTLRNVITFENDQAKGYVVNANTFTGQHRNMVKDIKIQDIHNYVGFIVSADNNEYVKLNGEVVRGSNAITINESVPVVSLSNVAYDKRCFGVISGAEDSNERTDNYGRLKVIFDKEAGDTRTFINSLGEGAVWVINSNGPLESGDYITTSNVAGYGQKQDSEFLANYTVAKITMDCDFNPMTQPVQIIKKEMSNVNYWINTVYENVSEEEYSNLDDSVRTTTTEIYYSNEDDEITSDTYNTLESNVQSTYTELTRIIYQKISTEESKTEQEGWTLDVRQELANALDEHGQLQWEDHPTETEKAYKIRYLTADGTQTDEANAVHIAAFVGCTYHCG